MNTLSTLVNRNIFYPFCAQALLCFVVLHVLFLQRLKAMQKKRVHIERLSQNQTYGEVFQECENTSDNFENLFEVPVLFFVLILAIYVTNAVDEFYIGAAWAYVVLRAFHSLIHCTYNKIMHRFVAFALSTTLLLAMWLRFFYQILS